MSDAPRISIPVGPWRADDKTPHVTAKMKQQFMGEFAFTIIKWCPACKDYGNDDCKICEGSMEHEVSITVPWATCKEIYKRMAMAAAAELEYVDNLPWAAR